MPARDPSKPPADPADWGTVRRFLPYLWPAENKGLRWRIVVAAVFCMAAFGLAYAVAKPVADVA